MWKSQNGCLEKKKKKTKMHKTKGTDSTYRKAVFFPIDTFDNSVPG